MFLGPRSATTTKNNGVSKDKPYTKDQVADLECAVLASTDQEPRIRTPSKPVDRPNMAPKRRDKLAGLAIPYSDAGVERRASAPAPIRAEHNVGYLPLVAC
jgi:hypothetical protein